MKPSSNPGPGFERFSKRSDVQAVLSAMEHNTLHLTYDLAQLGPAFNGTVVYGLDAARPNSAGVIVSADVPGLNPDRLRFKRESIEGRRVILGKTALGEALKEREEFYIESSMNRGEHLTWTRKLTYDDETIGAVQLAFDADGTGHYPQSDDVMRALNEHPKTLASLAKDLHWLSSQTDSLEDSLELLPPATPNAFVVRWDVERSTAMALNGEYGALSSYLDEWKARLKTLTNRFDSALLDQGDGQNIIINLPARIDANNITDVRVFGTGEIQPLIEAMNTQHAELARAYSDIRPNIRITVGIGHIDTDRNGHLTGPVLWEVGSLAKNPKGPVALTTGAQKILRHLKTD